MRPVGSTPTAFVDSVENVRRLKLDHVRDRCEIDLSDGRRLAFGFHLFTAVELRSHFAGYFDIEELRGLDLFHCRFTPDPRWNPVCSLGGGSLADELERLEKTFTGRPEFMDRAAHLMLVGSRRQAAAPIAGVVAPADAGDFPNHMP